MWGSIVPGQFDIDLLEESSPESTQSSTIAADSSEFPMQLDEESSDVWTPTVLSFEVESSSDEVEIIEEKFIPFVQVPKFSEVPEFSEILPPQLEIEKVKQEERYGFLYRVRDRQAYVEGRLKRVLCDIAAESPEDRKARRNSFQEAVCGKFQ